ncbi:MAG: glutathione S-transferase family protein [Spongiibacteraceae bacterium]
MNIVYGAALSPFVRKVLMVLEHKQIPYQQENILPFRTPADYVKLNPLRKVPAFKDEYITLADSSVISDYLEHKYPQCALYPKTPVERAKALWFEEYADSHLQPLLGPGLFFERLVAPVLQKRKPNEELIAKSLKALPAAQDYLETQIPSTGFLVGDLTIADLSVPGMFLNAKYAGYEVDVRLWPKLAAYLQRMFAHPLYVARMEQERAVLEGLRPR